MVVVVNERPTFRLPRQTSDGSCLSFSLLEDDDEAIDIKSESLLLKKQPRRRRVTFDTQSTVMTIPNYADLSDEERNATFLSREELFAIRVALRSFVLQTDADRIQGKESALEENDEKLRGLEMYTHPGKFESETRRKTAYRTVFWNQQKGCDQNILAKQYAEICIEASEKARTRALLDQERAWTSDELERATLPPQHQIMER